jgi:hypothetical protein
MKNKISNILSSLDTIINNNTGTVVKIKKDNEIIKCDDVSLILKQSNILLNEVL